MEWTVCHRRKRSFRVLVMVGVGVVVVKGWHLYGPTNEQVKKTVVQAIEVAQGAIGSRQQSTADTTPDPRMTPQANDVTPSAATVARRTGDCAAVDSNVACRGAEAIA